MYFVSLTDYQIFRSFQPHPPGEGVQLLEAFKPRWLEEPVAWEDDRRLLKLLAQRTNIPLSGGESEFTSFGCRALLEVSDLCCCFFWKVGMSWWEDVEISVCI